MTDGTIGDNWAICGMSEKPEYHIWAIGNTIGIVLKLFQYNYDSIQIVFRYALYTPRTVLSTTWTDLSNAMTLLS
jgi:hypothetical protein